MKLFNGMALLIKKNDTVKVLSGKDRGKQAKVLSVFPREARVLVEGINVHKRHRKPRRSGEKGQIVSLPAPVSISNVMLVCPSCSKAQRPKKIIEGSVKKRVCRKCGAHIE